MATDFKFFLLYLMAFVTRTFGDIRSEDVESLSNFQSEVQQCVAKRGLGLSAHITDHCNLILKFPEGTNNTWRNGGFEVVDELEYKFNVCETVLLWEQYRNMTMVMTREYLDIRPNGWLHYAPNRISQLGAGNCSNRTLCEEHLNVFLPANPPFHPRQFNKCAVVGNSGDLLKTEFGEEIDSHDAVFRDNEAPVNAKYAKYVGLKRDFRLLSYLVAIDMVKVGSDNEVLILKDLIPPRHFEEMIKRIRNPVYIFQGLVLNINTKDIRMKPIELALSMCDTVDIYGFNVDPGSTEGTPYFSTSSKEHNPLPPYFSTSSKEHNPLPERAHYQLLECLGVIRIHSPMRSQRNDDWESIPSRETISRAHEAALRLQRSQHDGLGQFSNCKVWGHADPTKGPVSGSPDMSEIRKKSNYKKWEVMPFRSLRKEARDQYIQMRGVSLYKMDKINKPYDLVCVRHPLNLNLES